MEEITFWGIHYNNTSEEWITTPTKEKAKSLIAAGGGSD